MKNVKINSFNLIAIFSCLIVLLLLVMKIHSVISIHTAENKLFSSPQNGKEIQLSKLFNNLPFNFDRYMDSKMKSEEKEQPRVWGILDGNGNQLMKPAYAHVRAGREVQGPLATEKSSAPQSNGIPEQAPGTNEQNAPAETQKMIYLTFDDGPKEFSGELLTVLDQYHVKATFFMLDGNMKRYPDIVRQMAADGQGLGLHGVTHDPRLFYQSSATVLWEMDQDRETLKQITGIDTQLIRTPYGSAPRMTPEYKQAVADHGYLLWDWNIDSRDWYFKDPRYVGYVIAQLDRLKDTPGPIVILLHERQETIASLPNLLNELINRNCQFKAIDSSISPVHF